MKWFVATLPTETFSFFNFIRFIQQPPYKNDESWLETNLRPHIENSDRNPVFISVDDDLYDEHIRVYGLGVDI